tara:strand:+ start:2700 stop:3758 length:1059 start_codon:yes stop_codon:yes gene_type:complete
MPRHNYIGIQTKDAPKINNYFETVVGFDEIVNHPKIKHINKPNYQGSLIETKVEEMVLEYLHYPLFLKIKNKIIIGCLNKNWYIIDGQHRLEMAKIIYENHQLNDQLHFCWFECKSEDEMKGLFKSLNHDSMKNQFYIQTDDFQQLISIELIQKLKDHCKIYFSKKKTEQGKKYCIEEFVENIRNNTNLFQIYNSSQDIYTYIFEKNNEFYNINRYEIMYKNNSKVFYVDELKCIEDKIIFSLKRNNFIEWLNQPDKHIPYHYTKHSKDKISAYKKKVVWINEFGDNVTEGKCPIPHCSNVLYKNVKNGWQCGHIISEYNRGETEPYNLRPICQKCNKDMGSLNWEDWLSLF